MKSLILKIFNAGMLAFLLACGASTVAAENVVTEEDVAAFKKSCTDDWAKEIKGELTADNKRFGANFCDCLTEEFLKFTRDNNKQPNTAETNTLSSFCVNRTLLTKTSEMLKSTKDFAASTAEETCKKAYINIESQLEDEEDSKLSNRLKGTGTKEGTAAKKESEVKVDYATSRFCKCASTDLSKALKDNLNENELTTKIDKIAEACTK